MVQVPGRMNPVRLRDYYKEKNNYLTSVLFSFCFFEKTSCFFLFSENEETGKTKPKSTDTDPTDLQVSPFQLRGLSHGDGRDVRNGGENRAPKRGCFFGDFLGG